MFSLIISIIAIALVVVLAGASLYYGGDAFNKGTSKGEAAKLINEGQQIQAAFTMFKVDNKGAEPSTVAELTNGADLDGDTVVDTDQYLAVEIAGWAFDADPATAAQKTAPSADVCEQVNLAGNSQATCDTATLLVSYDL